MLETKATAVAVLAAFAIFGAPLAAHAATPVSGIAIHQDDSSDSSSSSTNKDGDDDHDDHGKGWIPPVFVVPGSTQPHHDHRPNGTPKPHPTATGAAGTPTPGDDTTATTPDSTSNVGIASTGTPVDSNDFVVVGADDPAAANGLGAVNPHQDQPVAIDKVRASRMTPADQFMDTAYLGMGLLGAAALGLGTTAMVRAIRVRRAGKADYLYGNK